MKRKGMKTASIILTILSILILLFSFEFILDFFSSLGELKSDESAENGIIAVFILFFIVAFAFMFLLVVGIGGTSLISIILNSIVLSKTLKENGNIVFNIVMLTINFLMHAFVSGVVLYVVC